jgi:hypothetical protein
VLEPRKRDLGAGGPQQIELARFRGDRIDADQRTDTQPKVRQREGRVRRRAAEAPAPRIVGREVAGGGADDQRDGVVREPGCILQTPFLPFGVDRVFL